MPFKNTKKLLCYFVERTIGWLFRAGVCWGVSEFSCTYVIYMVMKAASYRACKLLLFHMKADVKEVQRQKCRPSRLAKHLVPTDSSNVTCISSLAI